MAKNKKVRNTFSFRSLKKRQIYAIYLCQVFASAEIKTAVLKGKQPFSAQKRMRSLKNQEQKFSKSKQLVMVGKKRMKKCAESQAKRRRLEHHNNYSIEWNSFPLDLQVRILACLKIEDLFESCLLVCKEWKNIIFSSESFAKLQRRQNQNQNPWGYSKRPNPPFPKNRKLVFENGPCRVLNVRLGRDEILTCFDQGIVCITGQGQQTKVGNPIRGQWKAIPNPSNGSILMIMRVDTSISPASFKIVAYEFGGENFRNPSSIHSEIFDSKVGPWSKGKTVSVDGPFSDKLGGFLVYRFRNNKIVTYDFEQDIWSVKAFLSPENAAKEEIVFYKEEPILVSYSWPWVTLWKEKSCCKGTIIEWASMAKLDIQAFLAQHIRGWPHDISRGWPHGISAGRDMNISSGDAIMVMVTLFSEKTLALDMIMTALVSYDTRKGCWEFAGSMEGTFVNVIRREFIPSLITVL